MQAFLSPAEPVSILPVLQMPGRALSCVSDGEIAINSKCVGCGLCAKSCNFGAIEVIESEIVNGKAKRKALKCESTAEGYSNCACVSGCPTGALKLCKDPKAYFKHLLTQQEVKYLIFERREIMRKW